MGERKGVKEILVKGGKGQASYQLQMAMERLQLHWLKVHSGLLIAFLIPSTAGACGIKAQHKLLILKSSALGPVGAQRSTGSGSLLIMCSYRQCFQRAFYGLIVHSEDLI